MALLGKLEPDRPTRFSGEWAQNRVCKINPESVAIQIIDEDDSALAAILDAPLEK